MTHTPVLTTERLCLRGLQPSDTDAFLAYFASDRAEFTGGPKTPKEAWRHLAANIGHWALRGFGMFAATRHDNDDIIGMFGHWYPHGWAELRSGICFLMDPMKVRVWPAKQSAPVSSTPMTA